MARNKQQLERERTDIQNDYDLLCKKYNGKKNKYALIITQLQLKYYKTARSIEYIINREYEKKSIVTNPNQLTIYDQVL
jgi:hypothetical protein